jgi:hypothetical protein
MRLPWISRRRYEWAYQRGQLQGNADARQVFRKRIEELESFDANDYMAASHSGAQAMRAACIAAVEALTFDWSDDAMWEQGIAAAWQRSAVQALREIQP